MINSQTSFNIHSYLDIFLKRIWYFLIPLTLVIAGTVFYLMTTPKYFRSETLVLVSSQKIPEDYVKATVTSTVAERLQSIAQEILSRTRLEQVITEFNLYPEMVRSMPMEAVVEAMRGYIKVDVPDNPRERNHFTISYEGKDPKMVAAVTNKLASLFVDENLRIREQQSQGTTEFLASEVKTNKEKVDQAQQKIIEFKKRHINELPENRDANLKILEQLNLQSQKINESIKSAEDRKLIIQNQLAAMSFPGETASTAGSQRTGASSPLTGKTPTSTQLTQLRNHLENLQVAYTDNHPDIIRTKKKIADLEKKVTEELANAKKSPGGDLSRDPYNSIQEERKAQLPLIEKEISRLKKEDEKVRAMMASYQARIESTPVRELTLSTMVGDFNNLNETYQDLLKKNISAQQAENLERRQKGEQFRIIDPARIPERPFKPDTRKVLLIGLILGFGSGLGLVFVREQLDRSFRDAEDLEATLGVRVLANIPKIGKEATA
ncbi:MAG: XrtA system polysaccharide chain length determinant [Thermodesulfobacteriota bacterium]